MPAPNGNLRRAPHVLLTVEYAGRTWRLASSSLDIEDRRGRHLRYSGGLPPLDVYEEAPLLDAGSPPSFSFEAANLPDLAALVAEHHEPAAGVGEIALYREGDAWEARRQIVAGQVTIAAVGGRGEPLSLAIAGYDPARSVASFPPTTARMDSETWGPEAVLTHGYREGSTYPGAPPIVSVDMDRGKPYPWVIGRAGVIMAGGVESYLPVVPCYPVWTPDPIDPATGSPTGIGPGPNRGLFAGHPVPAQLAEVFRSDGATGTLNVYWVNDKLGRLVSIVRQNFGIAPALDTSYTYRVALPGGGVQAHFGGPPINDAATLLRWVFSLLADTEVDWRRVGPALDRLKGWRIGGFWDQSQPPWQWLAKYIAPLLPVSIVPGPRGIYPVIWRVWARPTDAVAHIEDGRNACFEGSIEEQGSDDIATSQVLEFGEALSPNQRYFHRLRWRGAAWQRVGDSRCLHLRRARLEYVEALRGRFPGVGARIATEQTSYLYDYPTADLACGLRAMRHSGPVHVVRAIGYGVGRGLDHLEPGDVVLLSSSRLSLSRTLAHVTRAGWTEGGAPYFHAAILPGSHR